MFVAVANLLNDYPYTFSIYGGTESPEVNVATILCSLSFGNLS